MRTGEALNRLVVMDNVPTRIVARDFNPIMAMAAKTSIVEVDEIVASLAY